MSQGPRRSLRLSTRDASGSADIAVDKNSPVRNTRKRAQAVYDGKQDARNSRGIDQSCAKDPAPSKSKTPWKQDGKRPRSTNAESTSPESKAAVSTKRSRKTDSNDKKEKKTAAVPTAIYPEDHKSRSYAIPSGILRVVTWNVASYRSVLKSGAFQKYLDMEKPHVLCLQETKMTEEAMDGIPDVEGYDTHWNHSTTKKGYSGVAVFINSNIRSLGLILERVEKGMGDEVADTEGRVLSMFFNNRLAIINSYVPNSGGKLARLDYRTTTFEPKMRDFLNKTAESWNVVYCGDLNVAHEEIDIHDSKGNKKSAGHTPEERKEFGHLLHSGMGWIDSWRTLYEEYPGYTYYSRRFGTRLREAGKGWRLDYHLIDSKSFKVGVVRDCFVRPGVDGSDHYPLVLDYHISNKSSNSTA
ncbi:unnamed protein product [Agarophyton chilense]